MVLSLKKAAFAIFIVPVLLFAGADPFSPVIIDPTIQSYEGLFGRKLSVKFFVGDVIDKRANAPCDTFGMTRTGKNSSAPLISRVSFDALLKNSIQGTLRELSVLSDERIDALYVIDAEVLLFEITETNRGFGQEIKASLGFRVKIKRTGETEILRQFIITSEASRKALDTTKFAESVATNALINGMVRLLEDLSLVK
jgi:hypothetical protein